MLRALIFDCDGVLVDSEPVHFDMFQKVLREEGIELTYDDYETKYLAMDDKGCFTAVFRDAERELTSDFLQSLVDRKAKYFDKAMSGDTPTFEGVVAFVQNAADNYPVVIASGALKHEVRDAITGLKIDSCFGDIVSAEDVVNGKPNPEAYLTALSRLNASKFDGDLKPDECLVIEDSVHGIHAAKTAGMWCLAVTNSYAKEQLTEADWIVNALSEFPLATAEQEMK